ncbi:carbohydrate esterase family 14 [Pyrrhoderma noxium]|uniref:N-acetylglucosaminylphosphatidylinositol deacetylase n=1 Tax=Pyrrhoderma noxium TaxID=2282107 RepID=A0A286U6Q0_9AGAM|nr:carbohydrate esterase family 14 [Pyrrhoderma noxium]
MFSHHTINFLWLISLLTPLAFLILSSPSTHGSFQAQYYEHKHNHEYKHTQRPRNILLLTAHPDDECMFFAPTLLALTGHKHGTEPGTNHKSGLLTNSKLNSGSQSQSQSQLESDGIAATPDEVNKEDMGNDKVHSLCLSTGDADGLGSIRKNELGASLDVLGVPEGRRWVLEEPFKDNITLFWDAELIAKYVRPYLVEHNIDIILTFDKYGISSHPNHISLYYGVSNLLSNPQHRGLRGYSLRTTPLLQKYTGVLEAAWLSLENLMCSPLSAPTRPNTLFVKLLAYFTRLTHHCETRLNFKSTVSGDSDLNSLAPPPTFISGWKEYFTALKAMTKHHSQLVWFRWLYVSFSRYMWVNDWIEIQVVLP